MGPVCRRAAPRRTARSDPGLPPRRLPQVDCPPEALLEAARAEGSALLARGAVEGTLEVAIRPGCASLSLAALFPGRPGGRGSAPSSVGEEEEEGELGALLGGRNPLRARLEALLARRGPLATLLRQRGALVQAGGEAALVEGGRVRAAVIAGDGLPAILSVAPRCIDVVPGTEEKEGVEVAAAADSDCAGPSAVNGPKMVVIRGRHVAPPSALLCQQRGRHLAVEVHAFGSDDEGEQLPAQEWASVWPLGLVPGGAELEVRAGNLLSAARPLLVLPCAAAAAEANALVAATEAMAAAAAARRNQAGRGGQGSATSADEQRAAAAAAAAEDAFLREMGLVSSWMHRDVVVPGSGPPPACSPPLLRHVAAMAQRLVSVVAPRGCAALSALLLECVRADGSGAAEAVAAMDAACPPSLLHAVAGSGSPQVVGVLRKWGEVHRLRWRLAGGAASALSPLHVAAVRPDGGAMVHALSGGQWTWGQGTWGQGTWGRVVSF